MTEHESGLTFDRLKIGIDGRTLLTIDGHVAPGTVFSVMGPSGSGKSSLLAHLGGFLDRAFAVEGRALLDGRDLASLRPESRRLGLLFQDPLLFPHMSVMGNLLFGLSSAVRRAERRERAEEMLRRVDLAGFGGRDPATLSGGQEARVALARTLLAEPAALLLDEPFSRLDADLRSAMRHLVGSLVAERRIPAILVTHDEADALAAGGPVLRLGRAS